MHFCRFQKRQLRASLSEVINNMYICVSLNRASSSFGPFMLFLMDNPVFFQPLFREINPKIRLISRFVSQRC